MPLKKTKKSSAVSALLAKHDALSKAPVAVEQFPKPGSRLRQAKEQTQKTFEVVAVSYWRSEIEWLDEVTAILAGDVSLKRQRLATRSFVAQQALHLAAETLADKTSEEVRAWFRKRAGERGGAVPFPDSKARAR